MKANYPALMSVLCFLLLGLSSESFSQSSSHRDVLIVKCGLTVTSEGEWAMYAPRQIHMTDEEYSNIIASCYQRYFLSIERGGSDETEEIMTDIPPQRFVPCTGQTAAQVAQAASGDNCCRSTRTGDAGGSCSWANCPKQFRCRKSECGN